ncbi:histidine phosphatase family protein [Arthrobacter sp. zg-Y820]|uniref:histidine phosphatase family protein n=1 Tax=unclassified Arthrobacter TaxID=235627 RepID=UPI001E36DB51|nr:MULTISPECIES: histidine phosphatase family protein [unclassified Arthrobacter]MCC9195724.1 histidine phosphatase family protein [Arthrobacter sp. zg-Y820]MDK1278583.1 histidine phosphatase family protein [Arthrobacter sp. zg.Y820]MDK1359819.1 histidine phosphatase family protein [Arthrobacter sp. zg-Y1219]WIB08984.1 histidine phosphatase family protein [Arthrobacter sp. zg-Y820]
MRLILIRHGQTPSNVHHYLDTAVPGPGLTELGLAQAAALPEALAGEPIDAVYASNLVRTQLTAAPLAAALGLPVEVRDGLREVSAGSLEMRNDRDAVVAYLKTVYSWVKGDLDVHMPGGPNGHETFGRFDAVIAELQAAGLTMPVVVSHGAMIRAWCTFRADNVEPDFIVEGALSNTGMAVMESVPADDGAPDRWKLLTWMGEAVGGRELRDYGEDGPAGEDVLL